MITPFSGWRRASSIRTGSPSSSTRRKPAFSKASRTTPIPTFFPTRWGNATSADRPSAASTSASKIEDGVSRRTGCPHCRQWSVAARA